LTKRKLPPNIEEARGYEGYIAHLRDLGGKQYSKSFAVNTHGSDAEAFRAASRWLADEKAKRQDGEPGERKHRETLREVGEAWYRHGVTNKNWKASTKRDYRYVLDSLMDKDSPLKIASGETKLAKLTEELIRTWQTDLLEAKVGRRTVEKARMVLGGIFEHARVAYKFKLNPVRAVEPPKPDDDDPADLLDFYNVAEVKELVRAAESKQDGATFLTAALAGPRRGELCALRVGNLDFAGDKIRIEGSYAHGELTSPKSGKGRSVPMAKEVAEALAALLTERGNPGDGELVFPGPDGDHQDGSALRRRYVKARDKADLRPLRFHDLRHVFGSLAIRKADIVQVQAWMGHANVKTTMGYLHHKSSAQDAKILDSAFEQDSPLNADEPEPTNSDLQRQIADLSEQLARALAKAEV
jgi:integrase